MADNTEQTLKTTRKGSGAVTGATAGAQVGTQIAPGWGTLIGAILGGGAGALVTPGMTELDEERLERIRKLQHLQTLGELGLTDRERAALEAQLVSPVKRSQREQQEAMLRAGASADLGAGSYYRTAQEAGARIGEDIASQKARIESIDIARQREQRKELLALLEDQEKAQQEATKELFTSVAGAAEAIPGIGEDIAEEQMISEEASKLIDASTGVKTDDDADFDELDEMNKLYGLLST